MKRHYLWKTGAMAAVCLFILNAAVFADFGPTRTKRERMEKEMQTRGTSNGSYEKIVECFLKEDYRGVDSLAAQYPKNGAKTEDVLYLQALSLLKLNHSAEARQKLKELEATSRSTNGKAAAAVSVGDSYYYEGDFAKAYESYKQSLNSYPSSDQSDYLRRKIAEIFPKISAPLVPQGALHQVGTEESALFTVQVGSFTKSKNAEGLASKLQSENFDAYVHKTPGDRMYRVRVGKFASKGQAEDLESRLKQKGYPTRIYP